MSIVIKELRDSTGMSQQKFADHFGIPVSTLRKWEQGEARPASYIIRLLSTVIPARNRKLQKITTNDNTTYFFDPDSQTLYDGTGNSICVHSDLKDVKPQNLPLYVSDLFESYYSIVERFNQDCEYDKKEDIIWS